MNAVAVPTPTAGHQVTLLENGEQYFPRVLQRIAAAQREVLIETFILLDDEVGRQLQQSCIAASRRGVDVFLRIDDYGSADLPEDFVTAMTQAGVDFRAYDARPRVLTVRTNPLRRLHRKIVVIDTRIAFIGGINFSAEHLRSYGDHSKQDYAVELRGPVVADLRALVLGRKVRSPKHLLGALPSVEDASDDMPPNQGAQVRLVRRDNLRHRNDIERMYRLGIRLARADILIANAYFFPGYRLLRDLRNAAHRGVKVRLLLQGKPDRPMMRWAAVGLYSYLQNAGVQIFEYRDRPLHAKVAVIDDRWSTVGSSNLDPVSLFLNLEANLLIEDPGFTRLLRRRLEDLLESRCARITELSPRHAGIGRRLLGFLTFHLARRLPKLFGLRHDRSARS